MEGKFLFNKEIVSNFIKDNGELGLRWNHNHIMTEVDKSLLNSFLEFGILLSPRNITPNGNIYLSIPTSCTRKELSNILNQIAKAIRSF